MSRISNKKHTKLNVVKLVLIMSFIYFAVTFCIQQYRLNEYKIEEEYYNRQISEIKEDKENYETLVGEANNMEYIEKIAREKLGLVKPYEKIFMDVNK